jgi:hypothetical protein
VSTLQQRKRSRGERRAEEAEGKRRGGKGSQVASWHTNCTRSVCHCACACMLAAQQRKRRDEPAGVSGWDSSLGVGVEGEVRGAGCSSVCTSAGVLSCECGVCAGQLLVLPASCPRRCFALDKRLTLLTRRAPAAKELRPSDPTEHNTQGQDIEVQVYYAVSARTQMILRRLADAYTRCAVQLCGAQGKDVSRAFCLKCKRQHEQ